MDSVSKRGSLWHRWDPHIHAPGTILNDQYKGADPWEEFLTRIEKSDPPIRALGITDYYSVALYEQVIAKQRAGRLSGVGLIFPNVEMRLGIETVKSSAINIHLLFSPEDSDHPERIKRFLSELHFSFQGESYRCEPNDLIRLGKQYDRSITDDRKALEAGSIQFKVNFDELTKAWKDSEWVRNNMLVAVAGSNRDGTAGLGPDSSFTAVRREIERFAHIIFASQPEQREFWLGRGVVTLDELVATWGGCKPCLHGSDAHHHEKVGNPDKSRYCWIKGDLTFESLRQACIEPEGRALVEPQPPRGALPSQTIDSVEVSNTPWLKTAKVPLNPGLIAIIGARGSGKTALADFIAAGGYAMSPHLNKSSFIYRAGEFLADSESRLTWESGASTSLALGVVEVDELLDSAYVQYLSQQFVEQLCSAEGLENELMTEIERVIFNSHSVEDRLGASTFGELLDIRLERARSARGRHESALRAASEAMTTERARKASLASLTKQHADKLALINKDKTDRKALTSKGDKERVERMEAMSLAVDTVRAAVEKAKARQRALQSLQDEVKNVRNVSAPSFLKRLRENYSDAALTDVQWSRFAVIFSGDVDGLLTAEIKAAADRVKLLSGPAQGEIVPDLQQPAVTTPYIPLSENLTAQTLSLLEKELTRLQRLIGVDTENANKLARLSEKIAKDESALAKLDKDIGLAKTADERIKQLVEERKNTYAGVFDAIVEEERELTDLYSPLGANLQAQGGELSKLSFSIRRIVDVAAWAEAGERLLDLRKLGPFKGKGTLAENATTELKPAWQRGTSTDVAEAMAKFRDKYEQALIEHAPVERADREAFTQWARDISDWLYGTSHITVSYGLRYDGVEIEQLSPGTRGIVLLLLYVAVDMDDDRPLIIDQPEENLDPKSIYQDLVGRFRSAKTRRQIIIITHNANLVVNTDADQVIVAKCGPHRPGYLPELSYMSGGLENPEIRTEVCEILEGGEEAFRERAKRLRVRI
jgi:energy-coupling factor transporter ATP-binding protein EcfA2